MTICLYYEGFEVPKKKGVGPPVLEWEVDIHLSSSARYSRSQVQEKLSGPPNS